MVKRPLTGGRGSFLAAAVSGAGLTTYIDLFIGLCDSRASCWASWVRRATFFSGRTGPGGVGTEELELGIGSAGGERIIITLMFFF